MIACQDVEQDTVSAFYPAQLWLRDMINKVMALKWREKRRFEVMKNMDDNEEIKEKPWAEKLWLIFGASIILFSCTFLIPPIYLSLTGNNLLGAYIGEYFIPFLFTLLLIFIILVVIYIWWHMANQTNLLHRLDGIEDKLDAYIHKSKNIVDTVGKEDGE
jgi:sterol desaturase/sphingolipid hydroxylase (fatty acid hydroxylase superfamily)